eukprot:GHRQ01027322.1.p1 GENE.GHRQ01027322.1~~GHRQ01027322.1.p1  ORF type:complete len:160 (+),score=54.82 GHRQ01027322.1:628-1107(+)
MLMQHPPLCVLFRLSCRPAGKLKVSIKASWLRGAKVDMEALTEASFTTHRSGEAALAGPAEDEQVGRLANARVQLNWLADAPCTRVSSIVSSANILASSRISMQHEVWHSYLQGSPQLAGADAAVTATSSSIRLNRAAARQHNKVTAAAENAVLHYGRL